MLRRGSTPGFTILWKTVKFLITESEIFLKVKENSFSFKHEFCLQSDLKTHEMALSGVVKDLINQVYLGNLVK